MSGGLSDGKETWEAGRKIGQREWQIIESVLKQFEKFSPEKIVLFGSFGTPAYRPGRSDIDLCVITKTENKIETLSDMYTYVELGIPFDILLYTPEEWDKCITDPGTFAHQIDKSGMVLYGEGKTKDNTL
ncbi:MAG TPA: nucleotidyltransferase domain-containing protein [Anaerovoracaceae bacterium]|nr:nucleotidyltransferase domain-containing protein [Anaerovoracaceae bacterium]